MMDTVWTHAEPVTARALGPAVVLSSPPPPSGPWTNAHIEGTDVEGLIHVELSNGTDSDWQTIVRETGERVLERAQTVSVPELDDIPGGLAPTGWLEPRGDEDVPFAIWRLGILGQPAPTPRLIHYDADAVTWRPLDDGCREDAAGRTRSLFVSDDELWVGDVVDHQVRWSPVVNP